MSPAPRPCIQPSRITGSNGRMRPHVARPLGHDVDMALQDEAAPGRSPARADRRHHLHGLRVVGVHHRREAGQMVHRRHRRACSDRRSSRARRIRARSSPGTDLPARACSGTAPAIAARRPAASQLASTARSSALSTSASGISSCFLTRRSAAGQVDGRTRSRGLGCPPRDTSIAACTPPAPCGTRLSLRHISTAPSVPSTIGSFRSPRWPMRNTCAVQLAQPAAERDVEAVERGACASPRRHAPPASARRVTEFGNARRVGAEELRAVIAGPAAHRAPHRLAEPAMPRDDVRRAPPPRSGAAPRAARRTCWPAPCRRSCDGACRPSGSSRNNAARSFACLCAANAFSDTPVKLNPIGQHQPLLAAAHRAVDAPFIHAELERAERGDRVHEEQRRMLRRVDRGADLVERQGRRRSRSRCARRRRARILCAVSASSAALSAESSTPRRQSAAR